MNFDTILSYLFGTMTLEFVVSFYLFAFLGMGLTLLMHLSNAIGKSNRKSKSFKFNFSIITHNLVPIS